MLAVSSFEFQGKFRGQKNCQEERAIETWNLKPETRSLKLF